MKIIYLFVWKGKKYGYNYPCTPCSFSLSFFVVLYIPYLIKGFNFLLNVLEFNLS